MSHSSTFPNHLHDSPSYNLTPSPQHTFLITVMESREVCSLLGSVHKQAQCETRTQIEKCQRRRCTSVCLSAGKPGHIRNSLVFLLLATFLGRAEGTSVLLCETRSSTLSPANKPKHSLTSFPRGQPCELLQGTEQDEMQLGPET